MRILICEDDLDTLETLSLNLKSQGHHVSAAATADQALQLYYASIQPDSERFDLIITDMEIPGHDGGYLSSYVRTLGYEGRLAILTGYAAYEIAPVLDAVQAEYWAKPESVGRLPQLVEGRA